MKIIKPKKSKFDENLARRIHREVETVGTLVDFCGTKIYKKELEALREVYEMFRMKPEDDYKPDNDGIIKIEEGHLYYVELMNRGLSNLPDSVGNWTKLEAIYLAYNNLTILPESVGNWTELKEIYLWDNNLTSLPEAVGNWTNLTWIYLVNNPIAKDEAYITELKKKFPSAKIYLK